THAGAHQIPIHGNAVRAVADEFRADRAVRRRHYADRSAAGRLQPGAHAWARRGDAGHWYFPDLFGAADAAVPAARSSDHDAGAAGFAVVADRDLPDFHHPVLHLALDGLLQIGAARDRGGGDRRR